jgi:hypothetical protein
MLRGNALLRTCDLRCAVIRRGEVIIPDIPLRIAHMTYGYPIVQKEESK